MFKGLVDGTYALSGVEEFSRYDDWNDTDIEGVRIILNNEVYEVYYDPSDGYRSYGCLIKVDMPTTEVRFTFPPQLVEVRSIRVEEKDEFDYSMSDYYGYQFFDSKNGLIVLSVGTDYADGYYPVGNFSYHPENLSINKDR